MVTRLQSRRRLANVESFGGGNYSIGKGGSSVGSGNNSMGGGNNSMGGGGGGGGGGKSGYRRPPSLGDSAVFEIYGSQQLNVPADAVDPLDVASAWPVPGDGLQEQDRQQQHLCITLPFGQDRDVTEDLGIARGSFSDVCDFLVP